MSDPARLAEQADQLRRLHVPGDPLVLPNVNGTGHNVHVDCPDATAVLVREWIRDVVRLAGDR